MIRVLLLVDLVFVYGCRSNISIDCSQTDVITLWGCTSSSPSPPPLQAGPAFVYSRVYLWATSNTYSGNMGGIAGADNNCNTEASSAGLPAGTYLHRALLSDSMQDARDLMNVLSGPVRRPNNALLANNWQNYFDPTINTINPLTSTTNFIWTGIDRSNGAPSTNNCNDWTATTGASGSAGDVNVTNFDRLGFLSPVCLTSYNFICVSFGN